MNILKEYTLGVVRRNKRASIAIIVSVIISTSMLTSLCAIFYTMWADEVRITKLEQGDWHGELFDETKGEALKYVIAHPNVEQVMIKGPWQLAKAEDIKRPYLLIRGATKEYWESMPEKKAILEGRMPENKTELAISRQFFDDNPQFQLGNSIALPVGKRSVDGKAIDPISALRENEVFLSEQMQTFTLVGILDIVTNSTTPAYAAIGYINREDIMLEDSITVYLRFHNPRTVYTDLPEIARLVGYKTNEYGKYALRYNTGLLSKYLILPKTDYKNIQWRQFDFLWMLIIAAALVVAVFVLIIHSAFALSANSRIRQLGMLKSIGATPGQIRQSLMFEALLLSFVSIPVGIAIGCGLCALFISEANKFNVATGGREYLIIYQLGWPVIIPAVLLAFLTVWLSASIPARKVSKLLPIEAIRQSGTVKIRKAKRRLVISKLFGIQGALAADALSAHKKAHRTSIVSLTMSFVLLGFSLNSFAIMKANDDIFNSKTYLDKEDICFSIQDGNPVSQALMMKTRNMAHVEASIFCNSINGTIWLDESKQSHELKKLGGLKSTADSGKYSVIQRDGKYRIPTVLIALDDESFTEYCNTIGVNPKDYYDLQNPKAIVVNSHKDIINSTKRNPIYIPLLTLHSGESLAVSAKTNDDSAEDYEFAVAVGHITDKMPNTGATIKDFVLPQVMPMGVYQRIIENLTAERTLRAQYTYVTIKTDGNIAEPLAALEKLLKDSYSSGDYWITDKLTRTENREKSRVLTEGAIYFIAGLLVLIGISNAFSTVTGSMQHRRREFAMLRSVGMPPKGLYRLLVLEAVFFGLIPVMLSLPVTGLLSLVLLYKYEIYLYEYLPYMPVLPLTLFAVIVLLFVGLAYVYGVKLIFNDGIADVIKDEAI